MASIQIIPAVNAASIAEIKKRIKVARGFSDWVHLDAASGEFTRSASPSTVNLEPKTSGQAHFEGWHNPAELDTIERNLPADKAGGLKIEMHLMIPVDRNSIRKWLREGVRRAIFHIEHAKDPEQIIKVLKKEKREVGIGINPETSVAMVLPYLAFIDVLLLLGVTPGKSGQTFQERVWGKFEEIGRLRAKNQSLKNLKIEIDGGVNKENIAKFVAAGADIVAATSAIFNNAGDPEENFKELKKIVKQKR